MTFISYFFFNLHLLRYSFGTSWSWLGLWRHCWHGQWLWPVQNTDWVWNLHAEFPSRFMSYFVIFLNYFKFHVMKVIQNECSCIVPTRATLVCDMPTSLYSPTGHVKSPTKAQPGVPLVFTMHLHPFWIPLIDLTMHNIYATHLGHK